MDIPKLSVKEFKIGQLLDEVAKGVVRIPLFQREFVWDKNKVVELLNSIYSEFPIGTFFFWEATSEYSDLYRIIPELEIPETDNNSKFYLILDGQQRITSLYMAINGMVITIKDNKLNDKRIDFSDITFDLSQEKFVIQKGDNIRYISLKTLLGSDHLEIYDKLDSLDKKAAFNKCNRIFTTYPMSGVYIYSQDLNNACKIFQRINTLGKPLSLFDLVVASTWSNEFNLKEEIRTTNQTLEQVGFGSISPELYLQALSMIVRGHATQADLLHLKAEDLLNNWKNVTDNLVLAINYLRTELGVKSEQFLPYKVIIPLVTYFFYKAGKRSLSQKQSEFVQNWFWKSIFSQHYIHSTLVKMGEDKKDLFDPFLDGKNIDIDKDGKDFDVRLDTENIIEIKMGKSTTFRNGLLCLFSQLEPLHFKNGSKIDINKTKDKNFLSTEGHHIFPKAYLKEIKKTDFENSIVNYCFLPSELNNEIGSMPPSKYFAKFLTQNNNGKKILDSHLIPHSKTSAIWNNDFEKFLTERGNLILEQIKKKVGTISSLEKAIDEDPNRIIDDLEFYFRVTIDENLESKFGSEYWNLAIPPDIQDNIRRKINLNSIRHPDFKIRSNADKLAFSDVDDYKKIILKNWGLFEDYFKNKNDFEINFRYFAEFRNQVKHGRKEDASSNKHGKAALEWFSSIFDTINNNSENDSLITEENDQQ